MRLHLPDAFGGKLQSYQSHIISITSFEALTLAFREQLPQLARAPNRQGCQIKNVLAKKGYLTWVCSGSKLVLCEANTHTNYLNIFRTS